MANIKEDEASLSTPGERLKYLRGLLRLSRAYLQEKYGIPEVTLKSWENGTTRVTDAGVKRCIESYRNEGVIVSEDWVFVGTGMPPKSTFLIEHYFDTPSANELTSEDDELSMIQDANAFKESHPNAVIMMVSNDDMKPYYKAGDYIGGKLKYGLDIKTAANKDCIAILENGERYFRRLIITSSGKHNLTSLNPSMESGEPVLYDVKLACVACVIWHRWKDVF